MMKLVFKILILALCSAGEASSSSTLREELNILRQLSQDVEVQVPSRSPALPLSQANNQALTPAESIQQEEQKDEVSLSQAAPERSLSKEDRELMQMDLQRFEKQKDQKAKRRPGTPLYRGR